MKKKYIAALAVIGILLGGSLYMGVSYSLWMKTFESSGTNVVKSGCFTIGFEEKTKSISLKNSYPISDASAFANVSPYQIKVTNTCDTTDAGYSITLNTVEIAGTKIDDAKLKFAIGENGVKPVSGSILKTAEVNAETQNIEVTGTLITSYILNTGHIEKGTSKTFDIYLWIDESAGNEIQGQKFQAGIMVTTYSSNMPSIKNFGIKDPIVTSGTGIYEVTHNDSNITAPLSAAEKNNLTKTEYRYAGQNPNNYVTFNNELWRIIGLVNTPEGQKIKLVRKDSIGAYSWDTSETLVNDGRGVNEWSQADIMKLLNPGYESESVGGSLYYNKQKGNCYSSSNNANKACDFTSNGLSELAKNMIFDTIWNIGSNGTNSYSSNTNGLSKHFYNYERSQNGKICTTGSYCNDSVTRTTTWKGKVGLMTPSDYGYATSGGSTTNRETCLNKEMNKWHDLSVSNCKTNDWLYDSSLQQWTITSFMDTTSSNRVFNVNNLGYVNSNNAFSADVIRPTIYLNSNVKIISGSGAEANPYILG